MTHDDLHKASNAPLSGSSAGVFLPWDQEVDVAVIGFGGAGATAAIEAADRDAEVLVIERFTGGGATRMSGGVMYSGGGTKLQKVAGYDDTPEEMRKYLKCETQDAVPDEVVRTFCENSVTNFEWVESQGVPYPEQGFPPIKTSYPSYDTTLYYSGNEKCPPYCDRARPAPRGHRALGKGMTGYVLFGGLRKAVLRRGVQVWERAKATRLITNDKGDVIGVEVSRLSNALLIRALHRLCFVGATHGGALSGLALKVFKAALEKIEAIFSTTSRIRVRGGVIIAAGGFIYNPEMTKKYIPKYAKTMRLGTVGDDGGGIELGRSVGGGVRKMERGTAWMFINPPNALPKGILLDRKGQRVCNEEMYGASLGENIAEHHDGRAILLLDRKSWKESRDQILDARKANFQAIMGMINLYLNNKRANSLESLAAKCGIPADALCEAVETYNEGAKRGEDAKGKSTESLQTVDTPPYYAVDCDIDNGKFLTPSISLGGLFVNGLTAQVLREDGSPIEGLYAAGRSSVGVCSQSYVSGLSIADGVFSGRNAGHSAAEAAHKTDFGRGE